MKRPSTTSAISGCSTPSLRNSSYLFSVQRSFICNIAHILTQTLIAFFKLEMIHFYFFIFSLFLKVGENAVGLCVPRLLVPTGRRPSQRLQTSSYTRSELLWQPQVFLKLGLKFICVWQQKLKRKTRMIMCQESPPGEDLESLWETNQDVDLQCLCRLSLHCWLSQHHRQVRVHLKNDWCAQG